MTDVLRGKLVVVTGASMGIGRALTLALVDRGARVVAAARSAGALERLAAEAGPAVIAVPTDVADAGSVERLSAEVHRRGEPVHVVVNNAAIGHLAPFLESTAANWREIINTNLIGALQVMQAFLRPMLAAGSGLIINVGSTGAVGWPYLTLYSATKAALLSTSVALDREYSDRGVRVLSVELGPTQPTGFGARFRNPEHLSAATSTWTRLGIDWNAPIAPEESAQRIVAAIETAVPR